MLLHSVAVCLLWAYINQADHEPSHQPAFRVRLADGKLRPGPPGWDVPYLHNAVYRAAPVVDKLLRKAPDMTSLALGDRYRLLLCSYRCGLFLGLSPLRLIRVFWRTVCVCGAVIAISFI